MADSRSFIRFSCMKIQLPQSSSLNPANDPSRPVHGGALQAAIDKFGTAAEQWIDLSTGISPYGWPVTHIPHEIWQSLPDTGDKLILKAADYYGCKSSDILPISGSQFAIEQIPKILSQSTVAMPVWGYAEHSYRWQLAGHQVCWYNSYAELVSLVESGQVQRAVVINPNNPSTEVLSRWQLQYIQQLLKTANGQLLVDEAYIDSCVEHSICGLLAGNACPPELIILRSVGKFFGLAGIRLGFVIAHASLIEHLEQKISPWAVNHIARYVGMNALSDTIWQQQQRERLIQASTQWQAELDLLLPDFSWQRSDCFITAFANKHRCEALYHELSSCAILVRLLCSARDGLQNHSKDGAALRLGLPTDSQKVMIIERIKSLKWNYLCAD